MAEHDAERAGRDEEREPRPPEEAAVPGGPPEPGPIDEAAAWEAMKWRTGDDLRRALVSLWNEVEADR